MNRNPQGSAFKILTGGNTQIGNKLLFLRIAEHDESRYMSIHLACSQSFKRFKIIVKGKHLTGFTHVFVHLLDSAGRVWSQRDSPPMNGFRSTSTWAAGEEVTDYHGLPLPADIQAGDYWLEVGLYEVATGKRLLVLPTGEDRVLIGPIQIAD